MSFSCTKGFLPVLSGDQFINQWIHLQVCIYHALNLTLDISIHFTLETFQINYKFPSIYYCILTYQAGIIKMYTSFLCLWRLIKGRPMSICLDETYMVFGLWRLIIWFTSLFLAWNIWFCYNFFCLYIFYFLKLLSKHTVPILRLVLIGYWLCSLGVFPTVRYFLIIVDILSLIFYY